MSFHRNVLNNLIEKKKRPIVESAVVEAVNIENEPVNEMIRQTLITPSSGYAKHKKKLEELGFNVAPPIDDDAIKNYTVSKNGNVLYTMKENNRRVLYLRTINRAGWYRHILLGFFDNVKPEIDPKIKSRATPLPKQLDKIDFVTLLETDYKNKPQEAVQRYYPKGHGDYGEDYGKTLHPADQDPIYSYRDQFKKIDADIKDAEWNIDYSKREIEKGLKKMQEIDDNLNYYREKEEKARTRLAKLFSEKDEFLKERKVRKAEWFDE